MERFAAPDGRRLAYRDTRGAGPPVLCLAGLSRNGRDFEALAAQLAPRYRVIRLDSRGRGGSEHAADPAAEYTVPVEAGDARALLAHLGIARTAIVGTSRGGILGMALSAGAPGLVAGLVLNDVGAAIETAGLLRIVAALGAPVPPSFEAAAAALAAANAAAFPGVPAARWLDHARAIHDDADGRPRPAHDPALVAVTAAALDPASAQIGLWPLFAALPAVPLLVIRGANSDILSAATVGEMRRLRPDTGLLEIPGRGHAPFLDEPEALAAIEAFLETTT